MESHDPPHRGEETAAPQSQAEKESVATPGRIDFLPLIFQRGDVQSLAAHLKAEKRHSLKQSIALYSATSLEALLYGSYLFSLFNSDGSLPPTAWPYLVSATLILLVTLALTLLGFSGQPSEALHYNDVRLVGPLAEALKWPDPHIQSIAATALTRLLPRLRASDAGLLNASQRVGLCHALEGAKPDLILAILRAFEQVGDGSAAPFVERLARGKGAAAREKRIQEAAQECLPYLQLLAAQERASQTLLRPAGIPDVPPESLLRPAASTPETDPQQLLRPRSSQGG
ncbi:MAG TPA: hypothetical protein VFB21_10805 [Chthonomonadaceae bacterium]|nr:hypothetical protein [Chthonomonadaceae bacterium]